MEQRRLVDDRPPRGVDEESARLHPGEGVAADHPAGVDVERDVDGDHVGRRQQLFQLDPLGTRELPARVGVGVDDPRAEAGQPAGDGAADVAEADDADGQRAQLVAEQLLLAPPAGPHLAVRPGSPAEQGEDGEHGPIGHRLPVVAGAVGNRDAELGGGAMVDGVEADRGGLDQLAVPHVLQHPAVDPVLVTLVGDHQVSKVGGLEDGLLGRRVGDQDHLDRVPGVDQAPDSVLAEGAEADDPRCHEG